MKNLKLYYIDEEYINYLRQFDKNVAYNKTATRPYIGVVYTYNNYNYFAPLSSPKPKHINISSKAIDIFKIKNGELGVVNINNMIPTPIENLTEVLPITLYLALIILVVVLIVLAVRLIKTLNKVDRVLDDVNSKMVKVDGLFDIIDKVTDYAASVSDKIVSSVTNAIHFVMGKKKKGRGKNE